MGGVKDLRVLVIGLGPMGRGIARVFDAAGGRVHVLDADAARTAEGLDKIREEAAADGQTCAVRTSPSLEAAVADADLVIEAVVERMDAKRELLAVIAAAAGPELVVASNTSSLSISEMGVAFGAPERVIGMHFFNPPTKMRLVEVIRGAATSDDVAARATGWVRDIGKTAVVCADSPNFIVNRVCRPLYYEAQLLLTQGVPAAVIDVVARAALGHRMGPLELLDFTGLHTHLGSSLTALREFGEARYRPIPVVRRLVRAGMTGRAAGRGFYDYGVEPPRQARARALVAAPDGPAARLYADGPDAGALLRHDGIAASMVPQDGRSGGDGPALVVYSCAGRVGPDDLRRLDELRGAGHRVVVDASDAATLLDALPPGVEWARLHLRGGHPFCEVVRDAEAGIAPGEGIAALLGALRAAHVEVPALPGLVADRLQACLVNEALQLVEEGIADAADVDTALRLGMNHPIGPLEYLAETGAATVLARLEGLLAGFGDSRYRPAPLLRRRAAGERRRTAQAPAEAEPAL